MLPTQEWQSTNTEQRGGNTVKFRTFLGSLELSLCDTQAAASLDYSQQKPQELAHISF